MWRRRGWRAFALFEAEIKTRCAFGAFARWIIIESAGGLPAINNIGRFRRRNRGRRISGFSFAAPLTLAFARWFRPASLLGRRLVALPECSGLVSFAPWPDSSRQTSRNSAVRYEYRLASSMCFSIDTLIQGAVINGRAALNAATVNFSTTEITTISRYERFPKFRLSTLSIRYLVSSK